MAMKQKHHLVRFENIDLEKITQAQDALNALCAAHDLKPWKIQAGKAQWRELCLRMAGLPSQQIEKNKRGRPARSPEDIRKFGGNAYARTVFPAYDKEKGIWKPIPKLPDIYAEVVRTMWKQPKIGKNGKAINPKEVVRGLHNKYKKMLDQRDD